MTPHDFHEEPEMVRVKVDPLAALISAYIDDSGHTNVDAAAMRAAGIDPASTQARERSVPCVHCGQPTFNLSRGCLREGHYIAPPKVQRLAEVAR